MTNSIRPSPVPRSATSTAPFTIKRKQVNYGLLDGSSSQCSLASLLHKPIKADQPPVSDHRNERVAQLEKELRQATNEQHAWRHKYRLLENEREAFEASVRAKYEKEKEALLLEMKALKETHMEKTQAMADAMSQLHKTVASLREQLKNHGIAEEHIPISDEDLNTLLIGSSCKNDAEYIKNAYHKVQNEPPYTASHQRLWSKIQNTTIALQQEIQAFQAWRSLSALPVAELAQLLREEQKPSTQQQSVNVIRKAFFGRKGSGKRKS